ncbi:uncharacterized protein LOC111904675 [Lactuca sativa]|uniref:uncharacterized protein LOC111904675 n=1 Tax=Lactuca sativa TaxID=4236 RepID=UPI0022B05087|nr:uncharacterized protein LOC111904675 [Lactuca sativa]
MRQRRWVKLLNYYECEIKYHPGKANVVTNALCRKEYSSGRMKALSITIQSHLASQIKEAQLDALKPKNVASESLHGMEKELEVKDDGTHYFMNRIWLPKVSGFIEVIMHESHKTQYSIHLGSDKMYLDIEQQYCWPNMKAEITTFVEEEEEVEVKEVVKEEEEIEKADNETIEEVIWVNEREVEPPTTIEKLTPLVDQPQEPEAINLSDFSKDTCSEGASGSKTPEILAKLQIDAAKPVAEVF